MTIGKTLALVARAGAALVLLTGAELTSAGFLEAQETPAPSPAETNPAMEMWMKLAIPGEHHKRLDPLVGTWDVKVTNWMGPGAPPQESYGQAEISWILGGRYQQQKFEGQFTGESFQGLGLMAYDNYQKKYISIWIDTMSTGIMTSKGDCDSTGKVFTAYTEYDDPMTGQKKTMRSVSRLVDANLFVDEMYDQAPARDNP